MKRKIFTVRSSIFALLVLMLSICFAIGVRLSAPAAAHAADGDGQVSAQADKASNEWVVKPSATSWSWGSFSADLIKAESLYGNDAVKFAVWDVTAKSWFSFNTGREEIISQLYRSELELFNDLPVGSYFLFATVTPTDDYTGLNDVVSDPANQGNEDIKFDVIKATTTLNVQVNSWVSGDFDMNRSIAVGVPAFLENSGEANVRLTVYKEAVAEDNKVEGLTDFSASIVNEAYRALVNLPAGNYYLYAYQEGSLNYTSSESTVGFEVKKAENNWNTIPSILQWRWGEYDVFENIVFAEPDYGRMEDVVYKIFDDVNNPEPIAQFNCVNMGSYYAVAGDVDWFGQLHQGSYFLVAELEETESYSGLSTGFWFRVQGIQNNWEITPSIRAWQYGLYNAEENLIQAVPAFGGAAAITIYHSNGEPVRYIKDSAFVDYFNLNDDGTVPEYVQSVLKELGVDVYYMLASVKGEEHGDYSGLNNYSDFDDVKKYGVQFKINATENGWVTIPKILSWSEGNYDGEVNKIYAEALQGNDKMIISIYDENGALLTSNANGELDFDLIEHLKVGSYTVRFEIKETDSYSALYGETTFAVFEDSVGLTGIIAAVIVFAILDVFAGGLCITLLIFRRRHIEAEYRRMINKELHRR